MNEFVRFAKWLYPGMKVKRWIMLSTFGLIMVGIGSAEFLLGLTFLDRFLGGIVLAVGIFFVINGMRQMLKSLMTAVIPENEEKLVDLVYQRRYLERRPKVVVIGGGTGLSVLLRGIKEYTSNITAIVTVTDDGGSSGRLREEFDVLPPGDIRNCLVALADAEPLMQELFQFRFTDGSQLKGHNFGNLFITALSKVTGDFERAIEESSKVLAIRGKVVPSTLDKVTLVARRKDGSITEGETMLSRSKSALDKLTLRPAGSRPTKEALDAIAGADAVILGPGSLYTSVISNLLVAGIAEALEKSAATKIYICNVMTQPGETDGYSASNHLKTVLEYTMPDLVDVCIVNNAKVPEALLTKYKAQNAHPVAVDRDKIESLGAVVVEAELLNVMDFVRHNPEKLARAVIELLERRGR